MVKALPITEQRPPEQRKVWFPENRSLGELYVVDSSGKSEFLGEATGLIEVPPGKSLSLYYSFDPTYGLSPLSQVSPEALASVSFLGSDITDEELCGIGRLVGLREIDISCTAIGDYGVAYLAPLVRLTKLNLSSTKVTDQGLTVLSQLQHLEELVLDDTHIGDCGLSHIAQLPRLKTLSLSFTRVTNKGLPRLKEVGKLERLRLNCTRIGDDGLTHVARMKSLKELWVRSTDVTYPGLVELTKWLCDCEIIR
jgi:Leucine-rich repeat (LRR) protein